jgi:hypothetical protein
VTKKNIPERSDLNKRKPIRKSQRFSILHRDGFRCRYCGASAPDVELHVDHYYPVSLGGWSENDNYVTACADCNLGKSSSKILPGPDDVEFAKTLAREIDRGASRATVRDLLVLISRGAGSLRDCTNFLNLPDYDRDMDDLREEFGILRVSN